MTIDAESPLDRSRLAQTALVSLATVAALAVLAWVLAYWTWHWAGPRTKPRAQALAEPTSAGDAAALFGTEDRTLDVLAPTGMPIRLVGVAASSQNGRGYALIQLAAKEIIAVREGNDVARGIRLAAVYADHVILEHNGMREILTWAEKTAGPAQPPQTVERKSD